jgi:hypothetical protein
MVRPFASKRLIIRKVYKLYHPDEGGRTMVRPYSAHASRFDTPIGREITLGKVYKPPSRFMIDPQRDNAYESHRYY